MSEGRVMEVTPERIARFWAKVVKGAPDECWEWTGEIHTAGYGLYSEWANDRKVPFYAHRLSLLIAGREIAGLVVRHDCDNPPCVNPAHLRVGTQADNVHDTVARGRVNLSGLSALCDHVCLCGASFKGKPSRRYCDEHTYYNATGWARAQAHAKLKRRAA